VVRFNSFAAVTIRPLLRIAATDRSCFKVAFFMGVH
jgi:hypothetical protein